MAERADIKVREEGLVKVVYYNYEDTFEEVPE